MKSHPLSKHSAGRLAGRPFLQQQAVASASREYGDLVHRGFFTTPHTRVPCVSMATGAAPLVGVATLHRHGAEIRGDKAAVQA